MREPSVELFALGLKKSAIRKKKRAVRGALLFEEVQAHSIKIFAQLDAHLAELLREKKISNRVVMVYSPIDNEVDVRIWLKKKERGGGQFSEVVFPKVVAKTEIMVGRGKLVKGYRGILEPTELDEGLSNGSKPIDVVLVPGLAFRGDKDGKDKGGKLGSLGRLGYGGGFYDRFIARISQKKLDKTSPYLIGLFYEDQRELELPLEAHDIGLDCVITEAGIYL